MINALKLKQNGTNSGRLKTDLCHNILQHFQLDQLGENGATCSMPLISVE
jgi:hypothetical protein